MPAHPGQKGWLRPCTYKSHVVIKEEHYSTCRLWYRTVKSVLWDSVSLINELLNYVCLMGSHIQMYIVLHITGTYDNKRKPQHDPYNHHNRVTW